MKTILKPYANLPLLLLVCLLSCKKDDVTSTNGPPNGQHINLINKAPIARAGADETIILPVDSLLINGKSSYDPDGTISKFHWELISGPGAVIIEYPDSSATYIKKFTRGEYSFQLTVTDGAGAIGKDLMLVHVIGPVECSIAGLPQVDASLMEVGNLSSAGSPRAVICGSKIFYGGSSLGVSNGRVDIYDFHEKRWYYEQLSQPRANIAMTSCGNKVFFAGGNNQDTYYDIVDIYDVTDGSWSVEHLSEAKSLVTAASVGDKVFFAGGITEGGWNQTNVIDIYDTNKKTWNQANLSEGKISIATVTANNKLYFAGGFNYLSWGVPDPFYKTVDIYDATTGTWTRSELRTIVGEVTGITFGNSIYWGGKTISGMDSKVEVWDMQTGYVSSHCLSYPRNMPGIALKLNEIVFFSSNSEWPEIPISTHFDIFHPETGSISLGNMNIGFKGAAVVSANNEVYIAGGTIMYTSEDGNKRTAPSDKVFILNWKKSDL